jgi:hypothetical protein
VEVDGGVRYGGESGGFGQLFLLAILFLHRVLAFQEGLHTPQSLEARGYALYVLQWRGKYESGSRAEERK